MLPGRLLHGLALASVLTGFISAAIACGSADGRTAASTTSRLKIVTTVAPITSIVAAVAGDLADVEGVTPEGTNSHTFEPPPSVARVLSEADLIFVNGLKLDDPTRDLAEANLGDEAELIELGDLTLTPAEYIFDFSFPKSAGKPNPHLWTNPPHAKEYAAIVRDVLAERDADHAAEYEANYAAFAAQASELDEAMVVATKTVPTPELLTYHDAYSYFAAHYGWDVIGAIQVSSFDDPTPKDVAALISQIRSSDVPAIFGSEVFPSPVLEIIGSETGVRYVDTLRDDDLLGEPGDPEHSWLALMRNNFITMVDALGGDASALEAVPAGDASRDTAVYPQ